MNFFTSEKLKGMLDSKDNETLDKVFSFIRSFIYRATEYESELLLTILYTLSSDNISKYCCGSSKHYFRQANVLKFEKNFCVLKKRGKACLEQIET